MTEQREGYPDRKKSFLLHSGADDAAAKAPKSGRWKVQCLKVVAALLAAGVFTVLAINIYEKMSVSGKIFSSDAPEIKNSEHAADAVLVLCAQVKSNGEMSNMLRERVELGIELYKMGCGKKIIMSGDHRTPEYDEVNTMKAYAISQGVPSEDIFMDHAGLSTYESMYRAKAVFEAKNIIVVTQKYHLYRAVYDGTALGLDVRGVPCDTAVYGGDVYRKFREMLARVKDFGYTIVKPKPTYLGETIPVSGNGNITNDK